MVQLVPRGWDLDVCHVLVWRFLDYFRNVYARDADVDEFIALDVIYGPQALRDSRKFAVGGALVGAVVSPSSTPRARTIGSTRQWQQQLAEDQPMALAVVQAERCRCSIQHDLHIDKATRTGQDFCIKLMPI